MLHNPSEVTTDGPFAYRYDQAQISNSRQPRQQVDVVGINPKDMP